MRVAQEARFITHDGTPLYYRHWPALETAAPAAGTPAAPAARRALVMFHRGHEHSGRLQHVVDELGLDGWSMFAWDARGHGQSPGARGDSPSFAASVRDVDVFVRHVSEAHGIAFEDIVVLGQSVGAVLAATWAHDYAPRIRALVLTAPAFRVKLYVPLALPSLALMMRLRGNFFITSYVKARFLTHDPERIRSYESDPQVTRSISARVLLGLQAAADRVVADAVAIRLPVLMLLSGSDFVVHRAPQQRFFERLGSPLKEQHLLPGFFHDTLGERDRARAFDLIRGFLARVFDAPPESVTGRPALLAAHRAGPTHDEERRLRAPLPPLSPAGLQFAATRLSMNTLGRLADGVRLGLASGFDSGSSLDYVYRNEARGALLLGRVIDRGYLDAIGWRGIRQRREHLVEAIVEAARLLRASGRPVHLVDLAAGHGRYVFDAIARIDPPPDSIVLRDYRSDNVEAARRLAASMHPGLAVHVEEADAFDEAGLAGMQPRPTLAIVSGLYELFPGNDLVMRSLRGLRQAIEPGGLLVYTGQPWHPQLDLIARTLVNHRGEAWVMRRRFQSELDALVESAGFAKRAQWTGDSGIFTVSLAGRT